MKYLVIAAIGVASMSGGAELGRTLSQERMELSMPSPGPGSALNEGNDGFFRIEAEPSAIQAEGSRQALEYRVQLDSHFTGPAHARLAIEVVDDHGRAVQEVARPSIQPLAPGGKHPFRFTTPSGLRDGYYQVRVTAAMADPEFDELEIIERYFHVEGGVLWPISTEEWLQQSAVNVAVPL